MSAHGHQPEDITQPPPTAARLVRMAGSNVLLLHWPAEPRALAPRLPPELEIDTFGGKAWVSLVACTITGARPMIAPPLPGLSSCFEVTLRTYVRHGGVAGLFLFSTDASNPVVVWLARSLYHLPFFRARIESLRRGDSVRFAAERRHQGAARAVFESTWSAKLPLPRPRPGDLEHFLACRENLFTAGSGLVRACRLSCDQVALREARVGTLRQTVFDAAGLPPPEGQPLARHADRLCVSVSSMHEAAASDPAAALLDPALSPPAATFKR